MCQKTNTMKSFFLLLHHPPPLQKPLVLRVLKSTPHTLTLYEKSRNTVFLSPSDIQSLGVEPPIHKNAYLIPFQIPRDWFIH